MINWFKIRATKLIKCLAIVLVGAFFITIFRASHLTSNPSLGGLYLLADTTTTATTIGTWYDMNGRFGDGYNVNFTADTDGLIYTGESKLFYFAGSSNASVDKVCTITYGLFKNSETSPIDVGFATPVTFSHANSYNDFSLTRFVWLSTSDTIKIKFKSTASTTVLETNQLSVSLFQLRVL